METFANVKLLLFQTNCWQLWALSGASSRRATVLHGTRERCIWNNRANYVHKVLMRVCVWVCVGVCLSVLVCMLAFFSGLLSVSGWKMRSTFHQTGRYCGNFGYGYGSLATTSSSMAHCHSVVRFMQPTMRHTHTHTDTWLSVSSRKC